MIEAIADALQDDATLAALLTGGIYRTQEISRQTTPDAFDTHRELLPCALVKQESRTPWGVHDDSARLYVMIYLYDQYGYGSINPAVARIYTLLHRQKLTPDSGGCYEILHADDLLEMEDPALGVAMSTSRFVATIER